MSKTIHAVFENGIFRPVEPVDLPDKVEVEFEPRVVEKTGGWPDGDFAATSGRSRMKHSFVQIKERYRIEVIGNAVFARHERLDRLSERS